MDQEGHAPAVIELTDDAWLLVFDYLGTVADSIRITRVCRRWNVLGQISWESTTRLSFEYDISTWWPVPVCPHPNPYPHQVTTRDLFEILLQKNLARLSCLDLTGFAAKCIASGRDPTRHFGMGFVPLQVLNLLKVPIRPKTAFLTLLERLPRLKSLKLPYYTINDQDIIRAFNLLQSLKSLCVSCNHQIIGDFFCQAPQSLTEVSVTDCENLMDKGVRFLAEKCSNLETISITGNWRLTGKSITDLAKNCPKLKRFLFGHRRWPFLDFCEAPESAYLTLSNLPLLEELQVDNCTDVTDQVFYMLGKHCPLLRSISCEACHKLTNAAIGHLSPCLHLETINLQVCHKITDDGLIQLSSAHSELKKVNLCGNKGITDKGVSELVSAHPNLLELGICNCPHVTDRVLFTLEQSLQRREHTQPLQICPSTSINPEKAAMFEEKTGCNFFDCCLWHRYGRDFSGRAYILL